MLPFTGQDFGDIPALKTLQLVIGARVLWTWTSVLRRSVMPEPYAEAFVVCGASICPGVCFPESDRGPVVSLAYLALFRFLAKGSALTDEQNAKRFAFARRACLLCEKHSVAFFVPAGIGMVAGAQASCRETTPAACFGDFPLAHRALGNSHQSQVWALYDQRGGSVQP